MGSGRLKTIGIVAPGVLLALAAGAATTSTPGEWGEYVPGYATLFIWLTASGFGLPPGEDLLLAGAASLAARGAVAWWPLVVIAVVAVVASDVALFWAGRAAATSRAGGAAVRRWVAPLPAWGRHAAVAAARFLPGVRAIVYSAAGASGVGLKRFVAIDLCAAAVWVPLVMTAGAWAVASAAERWLPLVTAPWR